MTDASTTGVWARLQAGATHDEMNSYALRCNSSGDQLSTPPGHAHGGRFPRRTCTSCQAAPTMRPKPSMPNTITSPSVVNTWINYASHHRGGLTQASLTAREPATWNQSGVVIRSLPDARRWRPKARRAPASVPCRPGKPGGLLSSLPRGSRGISRGHYARAPSIRCTDASPSMDARPARGVAMRSVELIPLPCRKCRRLAGSFPGLARHAAHGDRHAGSGAGAKKNAGDGSAGRRLDVVTAAGRCAQSMRHRCQRSRETGPWLRFATK